MLSELLSLGLLIAHVIGTWYDFWFGLAFGALSTAVAAAFVFARVERRASLQYRLGREEGFAECSAKWRRVRRRRQEVAR